MGAALLTHAVRALAAAILFAVPPAVLAQGPRAVTRDVASYGPITACIGGYGVRVNEGEAARHVIMDPGAAEQLILITNSAHRTTLRTGPVVAEGRTFGTSEVRMAGAVSAVRYDFEAWEGYRAGIPGEAVFSTEPAHREYQLPGMDGHPPLTIVSDIFSARDPKADAPVLSRIVPRASADCATLDPPAAPGAVPSAALMTPLEVEGPVTFCSGQLGIALRAGERVRIFWPSDDRIAPMWLFQDGEMIMQLGGGPPISRPVANGRLLDAGFTQSRYSDGSGSGWISKSNKYAFGDGSPITIYISHHGASPDRVDAMMDRLAFFRAGRGCDVQAMAAP